MRYYNPDGEPVNSLEWRRLFLLPEHRTCHSERLYNKGGVEVAVVRASWVGLALDYEREPKLYLVESREPDGKPLAVLWCPTREEALKVAQWMAVEALAPK